MTKAYNCVLVISAEALKQAGIDAKDSAPHQVRVRGRNERIAVYAVADPRTLVQGRGPPIVRES
jgi:hypothetical protein